MKKRHLSEANSDDVTGLIIFTMVVTVVLVQIGRIFIGGGFFSDSLFVDSDVYAYLNRAEALASGRGWFDHVEPRINPGEGHVSHWTRPLDLMLLIGAYMLQPIFGLRDGMALWANLLSPMLMVVAIWLMYRMSRLILPCREAVLSAAIFALHPMILLTFFWGRADHHSLLSLGQVLFFLGFLSFFLHQEKRIHRAFWTGVVGAVAIWVNVEALSFVLLGLIMLGLWWLVGRRDLLESNIAFSGGLFAGIVIATVVERGMDFFTVFPIDTMGLSYVVLFALTMMFWVGIWAWSSYGRNRGGIVGRVVVAVLLSGGVMGCLALFAPSFFAGPFADVDELYRQVRLEYIGEQLPALRLGELPALALVGRTLVLFGILLAGVVEFYRKIRGQQDQARRWVWGLLGGMAVLFALLSLDAVRWSVYMPLAAAPGFAIIGGRILDFVENKDSSGLGSLLRPVALGGVLIGFATVGLGMMGLSMHLEGSDEGEGETAVMVETASCDLRVAADALSDIDGLPSNALVLIDPDRGSELLYRTEHTVLAMANHRRQPGFTFFYETMTDVEIERASARLVDRGVTLAMVCEPEIWPNLKRGGEAVIERLGRGEAVGGFEMVVEAENADGWWIYEVGSSSLAGGE